MPLQSREIGCVYKTPFRKFGHIYSMYTCTVCYDDVIIQEVSTEELQAAGDVTLDKKTIEQLKQAHKELKVQLQTANRTLERKKAMLEKQKEQNKETVEKTAALQVSNVHCTSTDIHTYIHTYVRTYIHAYIHTYIHTCVTEKFVSDTFIQREQIQILCSTIVYCMTCLFQQPHDRMPVLKITIRSWSVVYSK